MDDDLLIADPALQTLQLNVGGRQRNVSHTKQQAIVDEEKALMCNHRRMPEKSEVEFWDA